MVLVSIGIEIRFYMHDNFMGDEFFVPHQVELNKVTNLWLHIYEWLAAII